MAHKLKQKQNLIFYDNRNVRTNIFMVCNITAFLFIIFICSGDLNSGLSISGFIRKLVFNC